MKKAVKFVAKVLVGILLAVAVLLLAHPLWLAPTAKGVANSVVPGITGTKFVLSDLEINGYSGKFSVGGLELGNPEGFDERVALKVGSVSVVADTATFASDVIRLKDVTIKDVFVSYVSKDGVNNFAQIKKNASGPEKADAAEAEKAGGSEKASGSADGGKPGKKVIIERLSLSGIVVKLGPVPLPVPPITLTGIGEKSNGVTLVELGNQLVAMVMKGVGSLKDGLGVLGAQLGEGAGALEAIAGDGIDSLKKQLGKGDAKAVQDTVNGAARKSAEAVKDAAGAIKSLFK